MSVYRWSLPTRGIIRDTTHDGEPSDRPRFPTIYVGQPNQRQRPSLATSFSTLFDKSENRRSRSKSENLLSSAENTFDTLPRGKDKSILSVSKDAGGGTAPPVRPLQPKMSNQSMLPGMDTPKIRSFSLSSTETSEAGKQDSPLHLETIKSIDDVTMQTLQKIHPVRTTSSSYPSEGMRSPHGRCLSSGGGSSQGDIAKQITAEYGRIGDQHSSRLVSMTTTETTGDLGLPAGADEEGGDVPANDDGRLPSPCSITAIAEPAIASDINNSAKTRVALLRKTLKGSSINSEHNLHQDPLIRSRRLSRVGAGWPALRTFQNQEGRKSYHHRRHKHSNTSDMTVPILLEDEGEGGSVSEGLSVSFVTYSRRRLALRSASEDCLRSNHNKGVGFRRKTASAHRLRSSYTTTVTGTSTEGTRVAASLFHPTDDGDTLSALHEGDDAPRQDEKEKGQGKRKPSTSFWIQNLFSVHNRKMNQSPSSYSDYSHGSTVDLGGRQPRRGHRHHHHHHKFHFVKWVKGILSRTRSRLVVIESLAEHGLDRSAAPRGGDARADDIEQLLEQRGIHVPKKKMRKSGRKIFKVGRWGASKAKLDLMEKADTVRMAELWQEQNDRKKRMARRESRKGSFQFSNRGRVGDREEGPRRSMSCPPEVGL
ncbi:hypothetical protein F5Y17DRAFT_330937 [Xylariaceae sp. FL0594]|nr:hypothetical protein F5Y17DRAFT_330937 [Xylariaceae sp. FL0594]